MKIKFTKSSGNIFVDLSLKDADELYTRATLGALVIKIVKARGYSQREASNNAAADSAQLDVLLGGLAYHAKSVG